MEQIGASSFSFYFDDIVSSYSTKKRNYHNLSHLESCFSVYDNYFDSNPTIELAIWYHDYIYNPLANDNEEKSAEISKPIVKDIINSVASDKIEKLILSTKDHIAFDYESEVLIDIDLSILGSKDYLYDQYEENIRREYWMIKDSIYKKARINILNNFIKKNYIYNTFVFRNSLFEYRAKQNIQKAIYKLERKI